MPVKPVQKHYTYALTEPYGGLDFPAQLTPKTMLEMGIFEGKYLNDCRNEFPGHWVETAKLSPNKPDISCDYFNIKSRQPLSTWKKMAGYMAMIRAAGFSGIADILWDGENRKSIPYRSHAGRHSAPAM